VIYERFFGLAESPFTLTPDPRYLFLTEAHKEALASVVYGVRERRGFVLVLGEAGTGKTTLIRHVLEHAGQDVRTIYLLRAVGTPGQLLRSLLRELGIATAGLDHPGMVDALNDHLLQEAAAGRTVALIVDEAQSLSSPLLEELRMLSNLDTASAKLLQVVLTGQPELGETLARPELRQLRQRIGLVASLRPLTPLETDQYIWHRIGVAGGTRRLFTPGATRMVHRMSGGIPRLINVLCDKALVLAFSEGRTHVSRRLVADVVRDWRVFRSRGRTRGGAAAAPGTHRDALRLPRLLAGGAVAAAAIATALVLGRDAPGPDLLAGWPWADAVTASVRAAVVAPEQPSGRAAPRGTPAGPAEAPAPPPVVRVVGEGETLAHLTTRIYGRSDDTVLDLVKAANPSVTDVNLVVAGERLTFPPLTRASRVVERDGRFVVHVATVRHPGDEVVRAMRRTHQPVRLVPVQLASNRQALRVLVGDFGDREQAERFYGSVALPHSGDAG
jgi:general secretion pathway protein A